MSAYMCVYTHTHKQWVYVGWVVRIQETPRGMHVEIHARLIPPTLPEAHIPSSI